MDDADASSGEHSCFEALYSASSLESKLVLFHELG